MNLSIEERNQLVLENQKLIHYLLRPYRNKVSSPLYDYEDLVQVANEAIPNDYDFVNESMLVAMVKDICSKNKQSGELAYKAWTMRYVEGYGFEDIARVFGVSKQAIFSKIKKIDNKLKIIYSHLD